MSNYYTILTRVGAALHANAQVNQTTVPWTHMRLGDGNGAPVTPTENQTSLVRQVHTLPITDIAVHPDNPNWVIAEAVVPSDVGGWTVRETAIYGGADGNTCIAVGNYPETYKPVLAEGAGREMVMRMVVEISSVATVKLQIDPAVAIASRAWVESLVATPAKAGLVKFATVEESKAQVRNDRAVTPEGLGAALDERGGMPRFTPYIWGGRADAMPEGDTQSSGQQLLDLMYPDMREDVLATQFYCSEDDWQADPYKRVTHWSTGDGVSWMRPPDKNGVQPGSIGAFYGTGSNPAGTETGTAVTDAGRQLKLGWQIRAMSSLDLALIAALPITHPYHSNAAYTDDVNGGTGDTWVNGFTTVANTTRIPNVAYGFDTALVWPTAEEFRPRTWYGIWMIRMYGRVTNPGALDAAGLNARMDMLDSRVSTLEGRRKALGDGQTRKIVTTHVANTAYTVSPDQSIEVAVSALATAAGGHVTLQVLVGAEWVPVSTPVAVSGSYTVVAKAIIHPGEQWKYTTSNATYQRTVIVSA